MKNTAVAITGASGLLGISLTNKLIDSGYEVYALLKEESGKAELNNKAHKVYGNINIKSDIDFLIDSAKPNFFIHLAAKTQAHDSLSNPYDTFYSNAVGTLNVLESLKQYGKIDGAIIASSDKAYGEMTSNEYLESDPLNAIYPYDASKSITDILVRSYKNTYSMPVLSTRACNMYGPADLNFQRIIPAIAKSFIFNETVTIRNGGNDIREYIHVDDVADAYISIMKNKSVLSSVESFNISSNERFSTWEIFERVNTFLNNKVSYEVLPWKKGEISSQVMNSDLLREKTGWSPTRSIDSSLDEIMSWYINYFD